MTCVIIQWVFNLRPILVIGKRHHLAFIKAEGDAFSLFAWPGSSRETCRAADAPALDLAGRARGLEELDQFNTDPPGQENLCRQSRSPGRMCPGQRWGCAGLFVSFSHSFPGVGSSVFCKSLGLSSFQTLWI